VAIAVEEKAPDGLQKTLEKTKAGFVVLNGTGREWTKRYQYLYVYVLDASGVVQGVFGGTVHARPAGEQVVRCLQQMAQRENGKR